MTLKRTNENLREIREKSENYEELQRYKYFNDTVWGAFAFIPDRVEQMERIK